MDLSQTYAWERVVVLALTFHEERLVLGIHDKMWQISSHMVDEHLRGVLRPAKPTINLSTKYCMKWKQGTVTGLTVPANTLVADAVKVIRKRATKRPQARARPVLPVLGYEVDTNMFTLRVPDD
jgi:hypothetical protein